MLALNIVAAVKEKESLFRQLLVHPKINKVNSAGLMIAVWFDDFETNKKIIDALIEEGVFTDWFLFASNALRIAPPLNISEVEIRFACGKLIEVLKKL